MSLISLIIVLVVIGVVMWAVNTYIPMDAGIKRLLNIVVIVAIVLWLLFDVFHLNSKMGDIRVGSAPLSAVSVEV